MSKEFVPRPETQITVGQGGVTRRQLAGDHLFRVRVPQENGKFTRLSWTLAVYDAQREGDRFYFLSRRIDPQTGEPSPDDAV